VLVDTGGIAGSEEGLAGATARQSRAAAEEADLILFIVDGREGPSALDDEILAWLRKVDTPTFLVVNKVDGIDVQAALRNSRATASRKFWAPRPRTGRA
jgi:GTP-binding protein